MSGFSASGNARHVNKDLTLMTPNMHTACSQLVSGDATLHQEQEAFQAMYSMRRGQGGGVGGGRAGAGGGGGGDSAEPSVGAGRDKINGSDRECRRQQEIQSRPINNILVRQQLPPLQPPLPRSTPRPPWSPLDYLPPRAEGGAAQYTSHTGPSLAPCLHLLDIHLSACV